MDLRRYLLDFSLRSQRLCGSTALFSIVPFQERPITASGEAGPSAASAPSG